ncbi:MAG: AAA family ATPase [Candidatus Thorarchaeota archaeon]|nr:AAA family ATPase [Candidatus Thorarchaeota archaeon]
MKILTLEIQNFKPFKNLTLPDKGELPDGLTIIKGLNSTGKSSLFEAILWALWGPTVVNLTNDELVRFGSVSCEVTLTFEVAGSRYKIERSYDSASGMNAILFSWKEGVWKRAADKTTSVGREIESILNISSKQALNTLLVRQGEVALIANAQPSSLREMLVEIYNLDLLEEMIGQLKYLESDLSTRENSLRTDYTPPERLQQMIADTEKKIASQKELLKDKKGEAEETQKAITKMPDAKMLERLNDLSQEMDQRMNDLNRVIKTRDQDLVETKLLSPDEKVLLARMTSLTKQTEKLKASKGSMEEQIQEITFEVGSLIGEGKRLQKAAETLESATDDAKCPTCSQPLTSDDRDNIVRSYKQMIKDALKRAEGLKDQRSELTTKSKDMESKNLELSKNMDAVERLLRSQKEVGLVQEKVNDSTTAFDEALAKAGIKNIETLLKKYNAKDLNELHRNLVTSITKLESLERESKSIGESISEEESTVKKLGDEIITMQKHGADIEEMKSLNQHTQYVRRKLVSGFLADYVIQKRLIGIIRGATNPYVRAFTNDQYSGVDLVPTKAKGKGGAGLVIKVKDQRDNAVKKTSQLSFGDRTAVSLGFRLGISRTMSAIRPLRDSPALSPRIRCVLLDEPLGGLDKNRRTSVVQNLINDQSFQQILLITHTDVQSWEGVPVVEVSKSGVSSTANLRLDTDE